MEFFEVIRNRRSIRKFKDIPVEQDKIVQIFNSGRYAPSAGNLQDWKIIVVTEPGIIKKVADACLRQYWIAEAPVVMVVVSIPEKGTQHYGLRGERLYSVQNCAALIENMLLAATAQGLGTCWVGAFDEDMLCRAVSIPSRARPQAVIPIGYPDEEPPTPFRTPAETVVNLQKYGGRVRDPELKVWDVGLFMERRIKKGVGTVHKHAKKLGAKLREKIEERKKQAELKKQEKEIEDLKTQYPDHEEPVQRH